MERLKSMKDNLMACAQGQMGKLDEVNAKELGEVIDMIKDLEEAIYYCTITEAMKEKDQTKEKTMYYMPYPYREPEPRMYYDRSNPTEGMRTYDPMFRDVREGRSPISRKMYMESKELHKDKGSKMKDLEAYAQELTHDVVEMVQGASPEEQQYLEQRISALAEKIGHMNNA